MNIEEQVRVMPECPFSWSKQHSFERFNWKIVGKPEQCKWCGFVDDLSELSQPKKEQKCNHKWMNFECKYCGITNQPKKEQE